MIDAHCHLQEFENPGEAIAGLELVICCGAGVESSFKAVELAEKYKEVWATVGAHPEEGLKSQISNPNEFLKLTSHKKVVAIGECGLDYKPETGEEEKRAQRELFEFNIGLAKKTRLPLVIHCRNAFEDIFAMLNAQCLMLKVQLHCFTGNLEQMQECVRRGWYISFGGIITFKNSRELRRVAKDVPEDKLLVETDSPYLSPEPVRGMRNIPANVKIVANMMSELRGDSFDRIEKLTTDNALRLFNKMSKQK